MPKPNPGEKSKDYISRCVKEVMGEGKTQKEALGKCYGMLRHAKGKEILRKPTKKL
jgi:hypothetical protein